MALFLFGIPRYFRILFHGASYLILATHNGNKLNINGVQERMSDLSNSPIWRHFPLIQGFLTLLGAPLKSTPSRVRCTTQSIYMLRSSHYPVGYPEFAIWMAGPSENNEWPAIAF
jgi:hypothetical protein